MKALICGSMAYDTIMVFEDRFKNHILPDQVHILNVSFLVPQLRREFGGCSGNIAYNLKLLGCEPLPMATVGQDFQPYADWMDQQGITRKYIREVESAYTAQAYITTDLDDNQITAFHPGAMSFSQRNNIVADGEIRFGIISPDGKDGMLQHASQFAEQNIPFIFDPGQGMPMFDGRELRVLLEQSTWVTVNDYESQLMQDRTELTAAEIAERVEALIITRGSNGSQIYCQGTIIEIPAAKPNAVLDPTGCGDAYRAGLLFGLLNDMDWETSGRVASLMGAIKVESHGTQKHEFSMDDFRERFSDNFDFEF